MIPAVHADAGMEAAMTALGLTRLTPIVFFPLS